MGTDGDDYMAFSAKNMYRVPFTNDDQTEQMLDVVTLTLWKTRDRKAILYYGHEDLDN